MHTLRYLSVLPCVFLLKSRLKLALPPVTTLMSLYPLFVAMYFKFTSRCNVINREVNKYTTNKLMKCLMKLFIRERMSVHLQFDISDISQPFDQRCSELATEGRSCILTKLLLKAIGHSLAAELGEHPKSCV